MIGGNRMVKMLRSLCLAALLACGSAHAVLVNMGADPLDQSVVNSFAGAGTFEDTVLFSVTKDTTLATTAFSNWPVATAGLRNLVFELFEGGNDVAST